MEILLALSISVGVACVIHVFIASVKSGNQSERRTYNLPTTREIIRRRITGKPTKVQYKKNISVKFPS